MTNQSLPLIIRKLISKEYRGKKITLHTEKAYRPLDLRIIKLNHLREDGLIIYIRVAFDSCSSWTNHADVHYLRYLIRKKIDLYYGYTIYPITIVRGRHKYREDKSKEKIYFL